MVETALKRCEVYAAVASAFTNRAEVISPQALSGLGDL
jgi:hypothetical protein